jgi:putative SOS response-associated peptidase YedK
MCNLYSITTNQAAIIALFRVINRYVGNLPPMPGVFPDYPAPVVCNTDSGRALTKMRLGHAATAAHRRPAGHQHPQDSRHRTGAVGLKPENQCRHLTFCASAQGVPAKQMRHNDRGVLAPVRGQRMIN